MRLVQRTSLAQTATKTTHTTTATPAAAAAAATTTTTNNNYNTARTKMQLARPDAATAHLRNV
jgi:hypothetical protein